MTLDPTALVGRVLGPYTVDQLLGQGGFAWVFAARLSGRRAVALKVLNPRYGGDRVIRDRFRREAATAAELQHPNIVPILDVGEADGLAYFSMDLFADSLGARLQREGPLGEAQLIRLGADIASGLAFAHERGVVHRDINVHNILLHEDGSGVIGDFGIAHALSSAKPQSRPPITLGTPQYMSPEHAQGRPVDGRSDIYSLGVTLYKAASGRTPFRASDWFELARMHVEEAPPRLRSSRPDLSTRFERVILRCLAKEPADRYRSATALRDELLQIAQRTRRTPSFGRTPDGHGIPPAASWRRYRWVLAPLVALVVIAAVAALVVWVGR
jgi:serine/threonine-protein kinase